jgi:adenine-specific DNA-methyltransferase
MARGKQANTDTQVADYRYAATRKNNPPAGLAAQGVMEGPPKVVYAYNPHLPPYLHCDDTGRADTLPELLAIAKQRPLAGAEIQILADALRTHEPWLEWAAKEAKSFAVDPVVLHIHERISAWAILKVVA